MHFLKEANYTSNKFRFTLVFDITYPSLSALVHFASNIFSIFCTQKMKKMQDCISAYSKALNLHWTKAFSEGLVTFG